MYVSVVTCHSPVSMYMYVPVVCVFPQAACNVVPVVCAFPSMYL